MSVVTYEATVENGQIRLPDDVRLPEKAKVYVLIPLSEGSNPAKPPRILSPRLANPALIADFAKSVTETTPDAEL